MTKIKVVGALVFILSILLAVLFNYVSQQSKISTQMLNTINHQKAFTQEISKNIFYIYKNKDASTKQLDDSIKSFIANMNNRNEILNQVNSPDIEKETSKIVALWNKFYLEVQTFRDLSKTTTSYTSILLQKHVNKIYNLNLDLVVEFDKLINIHQEGLEKKITIYKNIESTLFFILVLLLIYLFTQVKEILTFIQKFLTTSKKVISNSSVKNLEPISTELNSSNTNISDATNNVNFLINQINTSIKYSSNSIEHSYQSLEVVENNIENFLELLYSMEENKELDINLTKKEDAIIQTLEELTSATQHLKELKLDLDKLISHKSNNQS